MDNNATLQVTMDFGRGTRELRVVDAASGRAIISLILDPSALMTLLNGGRVVTEGWLIPEPKRELLGRTMTPVSITLPAPAGLAPIVQSWASTWAEQIGAEESHLTRTEGGFTLTFKIYTPPGQTAPDGDAIVAQLTEHVQQLQTRLNLTQPPTL